MTIGFDLGHDLDLEFSRSNMEFPISQPKVVWLPRNEKQTYRLNSRPQMWPMVWIYQIVTGVTSVVGVPSTHLVLNDVIIKCYSDKIHDCHCISNHQQLDCLFNSLFRLASEKTSNYCSTGYLCGNALMTSGFPSQKVSNTEGVSMSWCLNEPINNKDTNNNIIWFKSLWKKCCL